MQDSADTTRFFSGGAMSLTWHSEGTAATVSNPGGIEYTPRPIVFAASLLWIERCSWPTPQRAVSLGEKVLPSQASYARCTCPLRGTEGWSCRGGVRGWQGFSSRGENSVRRIEVGCH